MLSDEQILESRYRIIKKIGKGGMGEVYKAFDLRLKIPVAVKMTTCKDAEIIRALQREAQMLANLSHPSLPRIIDCFVVNDGLQVLVLEYIEGEDLKQQLIFREKPFPVEAVLDWTRQLLDTLEYLHSRNILHRDIKPSNIKIVDNRVFLLDFGIAYGQIGDMSAMKTENFIWGSCTHDYAPLEQINGDKTTFSSDLYSLGATIYYLLTYQKPFAASLRFQKIALENADPLKDIKCLLPELPPSVASSIMSALELSSTKRLQTAREMSENLFSKNIQQSLLKKKKRILVARAAVFFLLISTIFATTFRQEIFCESLNLYECRNLISWALPKENTIGASRDGMKFSQDEKFEEVKETNRDAQNEILKSAVFYNERGNAFLQKGNFQEAKNNYYEAVRLNQNYLEAKFNLGKVFLLEKKWNQAVVFFSEALNIKPSPEIFDKRGQAFYALGEYEKAENDFTEAITSDMTNYKLFISRSAASMKLDKFQHSLADISEAIRLAPRDNAETLKKLYRYRDFYKSKQTFKVTDKSNIRTTISRLGGDRFLYKFFRS